MKEIIDLRKLREKHFLNEDGTYTLYAYDYDVHYLKDGKYADIDNTIVEEMDCFQNKERGFSISFAKKNENPFLLKIEKEDNYLDINLIEKNIESQILENSITYQNILNNIDIKYDLIANKIKDTIFIKKIENDFVNLIYRINTNFVLELNDSGTIDVLKDNTCIFTIDKPTLVDKEGQNHSIAYILEQSNGAYLLSFSIENSILTNQKLYPLTIDPTIDMNEDNSIFDTYIYPGDTNVNRNNQDMLKVGVDSNNTVYRTLMKFNLPTIGTACDIVDARVCLTSHPAQVNRGELAEGSAEYYFNKNISAHAINTSWEESSANWNTMHDKYENKVEDFFYGNRAYWILTGAWGDYETWKKAQLQLTYFNITNLVKRWYAGFENNGVLLKFVDEHYKEKYPEYYFYSKNNNASAEHNIENPKPFLMITYRNQNGLEDYMTYQSIGFSGGESHINNLTGNVTNVFEVNKTLGTKFPINLSLIYNTNDVIIDKRYGMPKGFKFNYHETLKEVNFDDVCLEYNDGDGTIHYFREYKEFNDKGEQIGETKIIDEDGLGLTAIKNANQTYTIKDKEGNEKEFFLINILLDKEYVLRKITNTNKDYIEIGYIDTSFSEDDMLKNDFHFGYGIASICDNEGNKINIDYNYIDDAFSYIRISSSYTSATITLFGEKNDKIQRINNKLGAIALEYNQQGIITKIKDTNGLAKQFAYYENVPYRLKKMSELGTNGKIGNFLEFFYDFNVTRVKDSKGRINSYAFNDQGNTIGITNLDADGDFKNSYGILQEYASDFEGTMPNLKNKLQLETSAMKYTNNYLYNSTFEKEDSNLNITTECAHSGTHSLKINGFYSLNLPKVKEEGMYTFSAYFKNEKLATLQVCSSNEEVLREMKINPNIDFVRYDISIALNSNLDYSVKIVSDDANGIIYIDDMQLEKGEIANYYNLVENSNFHDSLTSWDYMAVDNDGNSLNDGSGVIILPNGENAFLMHCAPDTSKTLDQFIPISGQANDTFRLSFWYKNEGIREEGMESSNMALLSFSYLEDSEEGHCVIPCILNIHATEWQFFQTVFVAEQDYKDAYLSFISQNNANDFYITNITLTKDLENNSYGYDEEGNLIAALGKNKGASKFHYDKNNQLTSMFEPKGNSFKFEYDNKDTSKLLQGISKRGISNRIVYDEFNNPIKTIIQNHDTNELNGKSFYIRLKASNKYLYPDYHSLMPILKVPTCSNESWDILKEDSDYIIKSSVIPFYLSIDSNTKKFILTKELKNKFELIENQNGSYTLKQVDGNLSLTVEENSFIGKEYAEEDVNQQFYLEPFESKKYIETSAEYTSDGRFIKSTTDALGLVTKYDINPKNGLVNSIVDPMEQTTNYTYNDKEQITKVEKNMQETNYEYNDNNTLSKIICSNKEYNFTYDEFLNTKEVKVNGQILVTNEYEENNGNLLSSHYGNNTSTTYTYDELDRIKTLVKNHKVYNYHYNNLNHLSKITSIDETYNYYYDLAERLSRYECNNGNIEYDYDLNNNVTKKKYQQENVAKEITYTYDEDDSIIKVTLDNHEVNFNYDSLGRLSNKNINHHLPVEYEYYSNGNKTSMILKSMKIDNDIYEYVYDELYNITDIYKNEEIQNHYEYDNFNELIEDDNYVLNKTFKFTYDTNGNILTKEEYELNTSLLIKIDTYEYSNLNWQDQLTKFNDTNILYDAIGNPTAIGDSNLTWNIRELQRYQNTMFDSQYFYNKEGIRTKKVVNGVETNYFLENSSIVNEETNGNQLYYMRTDENDLIGFQYNNETYYYKKNYQGDILGIYNSNYEVVCTYEYDSYGSIVSIKDVLGTEIEDENHIANINPYRYRSYYYDKETKLYYLNSRYYNPLWGRFMNADGYPETLQGMLSNNMYLYTENNPTSRKDTDGNLWFQIAGTLIGGTVSAVVNGIANCAQGKSFFDGAWGSFASGAISGLFATTIGNMGKVGSTLLIGGTSLVESSINEIVSAKIENRSISMGSIAMNTAINTASGVVASKVSVGKTNNGWFKPKKFSTSFTGSYQKKITSNAISSNVASNALKTIGNGIKNLFNKPLSALGAISSAFGFGGGFSSGNGFGGGNGGGHGF